MSGDSKVTEYLNKALRHELTVVNQYWLHCRLLGEGYARIDVGSQPPSNAPSNEP